MNSYKQNEKFSYSKEIWKQKTYTMIAVSYTHLDVYKRQPLHVCGKGAYLNAREEFEIYGAHNDLSLIHI